MEIHVRPAAERDIPAMAELINEIIAIGGTTAHKTPFSLERMRSHYVFPTRGISCVVATQGDAIVGFQALERCDPEWASTGNLPADWAVIATFARAGLQGTGVGGKLFAATKAAARNAGVKTIDATIRLENVGGRAFYQKMGFVDYRMGDAAVSKRFDII